MNNLALASGGDETLHRLGMRLFHVAGHTSSLDAAIPDRDIKHFVYLDIRHDRVLMPQDWIFLDQVSSASLLFSNGPQRFDERYCGGGVDYYAISLRSSRRGRSVSAHGVHGVLSRLSAEDLSIVLFAADDFCMFSLARRDRGHCCDIVLSDWFALSSVEDPDVLTRIDARNFSCDSAIDFFYDFAYAIARPYYIYPVSYEYARYEMCQAISTSGDHAAPGGAGHFEETLNGVNPWPLLQYGDDYVLDTDDDRGRQLSSSGEFALALLELELNGVGPDMEDENENCGTNATGGDCDSSDAEGDYFEDLDEDTLSDPIRLLEFIEKHST